MNHDIAHCSNENCPSKDTCYRYLANLEAKEKQLEYCSYFIFNEKNVKYINKNGKCKSYWK